MDRFAWHRLLGPEELALVRAHVLALRVLVRCRGSLLVDDLLSIPIRDSSITTQDNLVDRELGHVDPPVMIVQVPAYLAVLVDRQVFHNADVLGQQLHELVWLVVQVLLDLLIFSRRAPVFELYNRRGLHFRLWPFSSCQNLARTWR